MAMNTLSEFIKAHVLSLSIIGVLTSLAMGFEGASRYHAFMNSTEEPVFQVKLDPIQNAPLVKDLLDSTTTLQSTNDLTPLTADTQMIPIADGLSFISGDNSPFSGTSGVLMTLSDSTSVYLLDTVTSNTSKLKIATSSDLPGADFSMLVGGTIFKFSGPLSDNTVAVLRTTEKVKRVHECSLDRKSCARVPTVTPLPGGEIAFPVSISFFYAIEKALD